MTAIIEACGCGCGESLAGRPAGTRYATDACRTRAWKARTGYSERRAPKPPARRRARRAPDRRISYARAVDALAEWIESWEGAELWDRDGESRRTAEAILQPLLPPAARRDQEHE